MKLNIDGNIVVAKPDQSLYEMVRELGLFTGKLSTDPLAAKIAGRVFTLNYIPVRQKDIDTPERGSVRKAMAASDGKVSLLRYSDRSINEVADKTGFSDASYFTKTFKGAYGMTPKEYRNKFKEDLI